MRRSFAWIAAVAIWIAGCYEPLADARAGTMVACNYFSDSCSKYVDGNTVCSTRAPEGYYWEQVPSPPDGNFETKCFFVLRSFAEKKIVESGTSSPLIAPSGCGSDAECKGNRFCSNGRCEPRVSAGSAPGCVRDIDCVGDSICDDGRCQPPNP
jgi:hypothetical protein